MLSGCIHREIVRPEYLLFDKEKDISVTLFDGRTVRFEKDNYEVITRDSSYTLKGRGRIIAGSWVEKFRLFEGQIAFQEIQRVEVSETTFIGYIGQVLFLGSAALLLIFFFILRDLRIDVG